MVCFIAGFFSFLSGIAICIGQNEVQGYVLKIALGMFFLLKSYKKLFQSPKRDPLDDFIRNSRRHLQPERV